MTTIETIKDKISRQAVINVNERARLLRERIEELGFADCKISERRIGTVFGLRLEYLPNSEPRITHVGVSVDDKKMMESALMQMYKWEVERITGKLMQELGV